MTAILALNLGDRIAMMSDTAMLDPVSHTVQRFGPKTFVVAGAAIAVNGLDLFPGFLAWLDRPFADVTDLRARLGLELARYHADQLQEVPGAGRYRVIVGSLDPAPRLEVMLGPAGDDPLILRDIAETDENWCRIWGPPGIPDGAFYVWTELYARFGAPPFDPVRHGVPLFEDIRRTPFSSGVFGVGGSVEMVELSAAGATRTTIHRWPDTMGRRIEPELINA